MKRLHQVLGYAGLIPFFVFALLSYLNQNFKIILVCYSALIFSFLAGLLWASSLSNKQPTHTLYMSISAMLWSFIWIFFALEIKFYSLLFITISFSFVALYCYERIYLSSIYPAYFLKLRMHLSLSAATILFLVSFI